MEEVKALVKEEQLLRGSMEDRQSEISNLKNRLKILTQEQRVDTDKLNTIQAEIEDSKYFSKGTVVQEGSKKYNYYYNEILEKAHSCYNRLAESELRTLSLEWTEAINEKLSELDEGDYEEGSKYYTNIMSECINPNIFLSKGTLVLMKDAKFKVDELEDILSHEYYLDDEMFIKDLLRQYFETYISDNEWY